MRFIPAGAGNTELHNHVFPDIPVYPRWRGEHLSLIRYSRPASGLSPLARGTPYAPPQWLSSDRFIPAGAGNTAPAIPSRPQKAVYPRWRGEHARARRRAADSAGLSPLARGTHCLRYAKMRCGRFIPAGAGNTLTGTARRGGRTVYPRWRGEHSTSANCRGYRRGLSPLARGTQQTTLGKATKARFIPAGAGNTGVMRPPVASTTVYPRWRGEHEEVKAHMLRPDGLSPLARGTRVSGKYRGVAKRFIPAGAGNT